MEDLKKLPKLEATIQETLRFNPNVPMLFKATAHATKVRDYVVPGSGQRLPHQLQPRHLPSIFLTPAMAPPRRHIQT